MAFALFITRRVAGLFVLGATTLTLEMAPEGSACTSKVTAMALSAAEAGIIQQRASCFLKASSSEIESALEMSSGSCGSGDGFSGTVSGGVGAARFLRRGAASS